MSQRRLTALELHFALNQELGPLEEIGVTFGSGPTRWKCRGREWKSNARTDVLAAALSLLCVRARSGAMAPTLDARNGAEEADLCAKVHDLWHSPRKRIESHWLDAVFDEGTADLPSPLALVLTRHGARRSVTLRFAEGFGASRVSFHVGKQRVSDGRLREFLASSFGIRAGSGTVSLGLPTYRTPLFGREREIHRLSGLVETERLITLFGPSGVGKTRLAAQVARSAAGFRDGVHLVDLSSARTSEQVLHRVLAVVPNGIDEPGLPQVESRFRGVEMLLVLDNCETVLAAASEIATQIVAASDRTVVLATSIEPLSAHGEFCLAVSPFDIPGPGVPRSAVLASAPVRLFLDRCEAAGTAVRDAEQNLPRVLEVCRAVGGLALGIELAASALRRFSLADLADLFAGHIDVTQSADRSAPARHATLGAVFDWTYGLLSGVEQFLLACLSSFPSEWTLDAVASICRKIGIADDEALAAHGHLVALSVVRIEPNHRYSLLPSLRTFARTKLEGLPGARRVTEAFEEHFLGVAVPKDGERDEDRISRLSPDALNLDEAVSTAIEGRRLDVAVRFVELLYGFWLASSRWREGAELCRQVLQGGSLETSAEGVVVRALAGLEFRLGRIGEARGHYERSRDIALEVRDAASLAQALHGLGTTALRRARLDEAESYFDKAAKTWSERGDDRNVLNAINNLAVIAATRGRFVQAAERFSRAVELASRFGDRRTLASALLNFGLVSWRTEDIETAKDCFRRSLGLFGELRDVWGEANVCANLAILALKEGDTEESGALHARSLRLRQSLEDVAGVAASLEGIAHLALARNDPRRAVRLLAAAGALRSDREIELSDENRDAVRCTFEGARALLGGAAAAQEDRIGKTLSWMDAVSLALGEMSDPASKNVTSMP